ncbi:BrnA antitoxin family protein [Desulfobulbus rhabdoformis]|nr:BrnA antitoxin family protein [Desulfobulbus rhabdoformis]
MTPVILEFFREKAAATGTGYQTMINSALREAMKN